MAGAAFKALFRVFAFKDVGCRWVNFIMGRFAGFNQCSFYLDRVFTLGILTLRTIAVYGSRERLPAIRTQGPWMTTGRMAVSGRTSAVFGGLMSTLGEEIRQRLSAQFQRIADGYDVAPGPRFRLEGLMEAAVLIGDCEENALRELIAELHRDIVGESLDARLGEDWQRWHPFPQIPMYMERAPVSPSTSD